MLQANVAVVGAKALGIEPQRFERCGRRPRQGHFLRRDAVERFTQVAPHPRRELVERRQHRVFAASLGRFGLDRHARLRVNHLCRERVGIADPGDAARENRFDVLAQRNLGRQRVVERVGEAFFMSRSVSCTRLGGKTLTYWDCAIATSSATRNDRSNTGSPVKFLKSVIRIQSRSLNASARCEMLSCAGHMCQARPPTTARA